MADGSTFFAEPFRLAAPDIRVQRRSLELQPVARTILDAFPHPCLMINEWRQIISVNRRLEQWLGIKEIEEIVGLRPGEALGCCRANEGPGGCGTSKACAHCGAVNAILESRRKLAAVERECRLIVKRGEEWECLDLRVSAAPVELGLNFAATLVTITDISHEKRRRALERVFLHDVANTVGALGGMLRYADRSDSSGEDEVFFERARQLARQLTSEISEHRDLLAAETNELKVKRAPVRSLELLSEVAAGVKAGMPGTLRRVEIDTGSVECTFETDPTLLRRTLANLIKNAFEASSAEQAVHAGCALDGTGIRFWVRNASVMPQEVQLQIFQRTFSTKGSDRGLGTYSVKLLGEKYLKGKVSFVSTPSTGTVFSLCLPLA